MTKIVFYRSDGIFYGFEEQGHTGYGEEGDDILCSAISAMTMFLINTVEVAFSSSIDYEIDDGTTTIRVTCKSALPEFEEDDLKRYAVSGIFPGYYLADYIPADSDGFGREDDYEDIYYDEFFNRLYASNLPAARAQAECLAQKRRAYWEDPAHDREHRMYKRLLSHKKEQ